MGWDRGRTCASEGATTGGDGKRRCQHKGSGVQAAAGETVGSGSALRNTFVCWQLMCHYGLEGLCVHMPATGDAGDSSWSD